MRTLPILVLDELILILLFSVLVFMTFMHSFHLNNYERPKGSDRYQSSLIFFYNILGSLFIHY